MKKETGRPEEKSVDASIPEGLPGEHHQRVRAVHLQRLRLEDSACHLPRHRGRGERVGFRCKSILSVTRGMVGLGGVGFLGLPRIHPQLFRCGPKH